jgi:hypothetical protein
MSAFDPLQTFGTCAILEWMKQKTEAEALAEVRRHTTGNRREIESSKYAGCVSCCDVFDVKDIGEWKDEWTSPEKQNRVRRWSAKCPRCGSPTVVGSSTGLLDNQAYLPIMNGIIAEQPRKRR